MIANTLQLSVGDRVLICGVKGGYTAALCAHIVGPKGRVVCLETNPLIVDHARDGIRRAGLERRVDIHLVKDVTLGFKDTEPWDAAVVNGKIPKVPRPIIQQMVDGGRLLIFLQDANEDSQTAFLIRKSGTAVENKSLAKFIFTPIYGEFGFEPTNWPDNLNLLGLDPHDVFLSYSTRDQEDCNVWMQKLESAGIRCWQSARNHPVGQDGYETAIMEALRVAKLFVILLSHDSLRSDHVKNELTNATALKKTILPLRLEACPLRLPASFQYHLERFQQFSLDEISPDIVIAAAKKLLGYSDGERGNSKSWNSVKSLDGEMQEPRDSKFMLMLEMAVDDSHLTASEMQFLCKEAVAEKLTSDAGAREFVIAAAKAIQPSIQIES
jgi:protein-L-isoaspartate O-methyltransferase